RPAIAVRIPAGELARPIPTGRYAVMAELWRFRSQVEIDRLAYAGIEAGTGEAIEDDDAELLANAAIVGGTPWQTGDTDMDLAALAEGCEAVAAKRLQERYRDELAARSAEQLDRSAIQLRNLERRFDEEDRRLTGLIDRQRRSHRVRGSIIAANEGRQ